MSQVISSYWEHLIKLFDEIWAVDFEFTAIEGESVVEVNCMVAKELISGKEFKLFSDELIKLKEPPFNIKEKAIFIAYNASAELSCFMKLGWMKPFYILDLYVEFKRLKNGLSDDGFSLIDALFYFGIKSVTSEYKETMRKLSMRGGPYTAEEKNELLNYCASDVYPLEELLKKMQCAEAEIQFSIYRGEFMWSVASIESIGTPIDTEIFEKIKQSWPNVKANLISDIDKQFGVYQDSVFKIKLFEKYLSDNKISWPRTLDGRIRLDQETFSSGCEVYPQLKPLKELRSIVSTLNLVKISVGRDGRNRVSLFPYKSKTARCQPSNSKFIFGPSKALRGLIKPTEGNSIAYIDWSQQEFGIAAALSRDQKMKNAYLSGDPYLEFGKQAGAIPFNGTKQSHPVERNLYKQCVLAVQYGMGPESLSSRLKISVPEARHLLQVHRETYSDFWKWMDSVLDSTMLSGHVSTVFDWRVNVPDEANMRSLGNFPMQANGSEMLRLACIKLIQEEKIKVCATIHDAILIQDKTENIFATSELASKVMEEASAIVLDGFRLRSDIQIIKYPDRYMDEDGEEMWKRIMSYLDGFSIGVERLCT